MYRFVSCNILILKKKLMSKFCATIVLEKLQSNGCKTFHRKTYVTTFIVFVYEKSCNGFGNKRFFLERPSQKTKNLAKSSKKNYLLNKYHHPFIKED